MILTIFIGILLINDNIALPSVVKMMDIGYQVIEFPKENQQPLFFPTMQDHFDATNKNMWNQAYYVNATQWKADEHAPIFLCVGGEGPPLDISVITDSAHCTDTVEWLPQVGGIMFAVEHRYYGCHNKNACPVDKISDSKSLKFLNSQQALEDLALFQRFATQKYNLKPTNRWVVVGGSYPGMLAAWARMTYPHLFFAAVASSAPVEAQLNMKGYNDIVAEAYQTEIVGGSQKCEEIIRFGHEKIGESLKTARGRRGLEGLFGLKRKSLESTDAQRSFCGNGVANFPAQDNDPACTEPVCNIEKICSFLITSTDEGDDEVTALMNLRNLQSIPSEIPERNTDVDIWTWQVCTEFGYFQTCLDDSNCMFTKGLTTVESMFEDACAQYGITDLNYLKQVIVRTNIRHGGVRSDVQRILWVDGSIDPWTALAVRKLSKQEELDKQEIITVQGASHHAWTHPSMPTDQPSVIAARKAIRLIVSDWLQQ